MTVLAELLDLYAYNRWANDRTLAVTGRLDGDRFTRDLGSSYPSVRDTLVHTLSAEWIWLERWLGRSPAAVPADWALATNRDIADRWAVIETGRRAFLGRLAPAALTEVIAYRNTRGEPFHAPLGQLLRHVVNHSSYHRGQITTMLRQLGAEPVATDLVLYHRELAARGQPA